MLTKKKGILRKNVAMSLAFGKQQFPLKKGGGARKQVVMSSFDPGANPRNPITIVFTFSQDGKLWI